MAKKSQPLGQGSGATANINPTGMYSSGRTCAHADRQGPRGVRGATLGAIRAAQKIIAEGGTVTPQQVAASAVNRGRLDWRQQIIRNAQACIAGGIDVVDETDENIVFPDGPEAA